MRGFIPPPEPKVTINYVIRVLVVDASTDPTKIETWSTLNFFGSQISKFHLSYLFDFQWTPITRTVCSDDL